MFNGCSSLTSINVEGLDTSNVSYMSEIFRGCSLLTSLDLSSWEVGNVTSFYAMFDGCSSLNSLNLNNWDADSVADMSYMFSNCSNLTGTLDLSNIKLKTSGTTPVSNVFTNCNNLTKIIIPTFKENCSTVPIGWFSGCNNLVEVDLGEMISSFERCHHTSNLVPFGFYRNNNLTTISGKFNVDFTKVFDAKYLIEDYWLTIGWAWFNGCNNIKDINFTGTIYTSADFTDYRIFRGCNTSNFTEATWLSFVNIFPQNTDGVTKKICVGSNLNQIPTTYATILTNKGYTLYGA